MLTSQEFIGKLKDLKYKVKFNGENINLYNPGTKYNIFCGFVCTHSHTYSFIGEIPHETLLLVSEYMLTPIEKRGVVKSEYYQIPLPDLTTTKGEQQYLTFRDGCYFVTKLNKNLKQKFTEKELEDVPKFYKDFAVTDAPKFYKDFAITIDEKEEIISD